MTEEIKAIIEKNLPAQVGDVLKKRLEQAERDADVVKMQQIQLDAKSKVIEEASKEITEYKKNDARNAGLDAREKEIEKKEAGLNLAEAKYQLEAEKAKTTFAQGVAMGLVRNTEYRRILQDSQTHPTRDQFGNTQYNSSNQNSDEKKIAE